MLINTRSNVIKLLPIAKKLKKREDFKIIDLGQHDTRNLRKILKFPKVDYQLDISPREKWSKAPKIFKFFLVFLWFFKNFLKLRKILIKEGEILLIFGNTLQVPMGILAAKSISKKIKIIHIEAGVRGRGKDTFWYDLLYKIGDYNSDFLFATWPSCVENLKKEGVKGKIVLIKDPIFDSVKEALKLKPKIKIPREEFILANCTRAIRKREKMKNFVESLIDSPIRIVLIINPFIKHRLRTERMLEKLKKEAHIEIMDPVPYVDFIHLLKNSVGVITDSGGVEEECVVLKKPCIIINDFIQLPEVEEAGIGKIVGCNKESILYFLRKIHRGKFPICKKLEFKYESRDVEKEILHVLVN